MSFSSLSGGLSLIFFRLLSAPSSGGGCFRGASRESSLGPPAPAGASLAGGRRAPTGLPFAPPPPSWGFRGCPPRDAEKVKAGNATMRHTAETIRLCVRFGVACALEKPRQFEAFPSAANQVTHPPRLCLRVHSGHVPIRSSLAQAHPACHMAHRFRVSAFASNLPW